MRRTSVRSLCLCCALAGLVAAGCGGDDPFTDAAPAPDGPAVDAVTVDAMVDAGAPDADVTAPDTTISDAPADPDNDATPTFAFTSDDAGATFACRVDNQTFAACTSPHTTASLADGAHTFEVRAVDGADNTDATAAAHAWTVDTDAPDTLIETAPPPLDNSPDVTFAFVADEAGSTFECRVDGGAFAPCASPHTVLDLPDGDRTFAVRAIDPAGNPDATPATYDWTLDATTPNTVIDGGPPDPDNQTTVTFTFSSPNVGAGGTFACALDGGAFAACTSPHVVTGLAEGEHAFAVRVTDGAGNPDPTPAEHAWEIDLTPPDTTLTATPVDPTSQPAGTFAFSSEAGATFACRVDGAAFAPCTSPFTTDALADGDHTVEVRAIDDAGNADPTPAAFTWEVDTVAPDTTITVAPAALTNQISAAFQFTSSEVGGGFHCRLDAGGFIPCASPFSFPGLAPGSHTVQIRALDLAGNVDASPATHTWVIDTTPPDTTITVAPASPTAATAASFEFTSELGATFECRLDGGGFAACTSPHAYAGLAGGTHAFEVRAIDAAGNVDPGTAQHTWTVDLTAPDTSIVAAPNSPTIETTATFTFTATEAGGTFECRLDGGAFAACTSPQTYTGLAATSHTFQVRAIDVVGNVDASPASRTWTIDGAPPDTTINLSPPALTNQTTALFGFASTESGSTFQCAVDGGAFAACTSPRSVTGLASGAHTFAVRAIDPVGNVDPTPASYDWTVDIAAPDTTITATPANPTAQTSASFSFTATEPGSSFQCRLDGQAFAACTVPRAYAGLGAGSHTFDVRAIDPAGNVDGSPASFTWTIDLSPPDTTIIAAPATTTSATGATFQFTATEGGSTFACSLDGAAFTACTSPLVIAGPLAAGAHTFAVRATDPAGGTDPTPATHAWTIDLSPPDTTLLSAPPTPTTQTTATFTFNASEGGSTFQCRVDAGAFAACTSPHVLSGLTGGTRTFEVRAIDGAGNADPSPASHTWTVDLSPPDTAVVSGPSSPTSQTAASFTFTATEGGATFACRVDGGAFASCASPQSYTGLAAGAHTFEVRATDLAGNTDASPASYAWTVDLTPPDTTLGNLPASPTDQTTASITLASEAGATFECRLDGGAFAACTSPHPLAGLGEGAHTFEARATDVAGNTDPSPAAHAWTVDLTPPDTTIDTGPTGTVGSTTATFTFSAEAGATFECALDGGAFAACVSGVSFAGLAPGAHTFGVRARDVAGNVDPSPATRAWTVDTAAPETTIDSAPAANTSLTTATFTFSASEPGSTFACALDGGAFAACTSPRVYPGLASGPHTFAVRATDGGGNTDASPATHAWTIDTTPPDTTINSGPLDPTGVTSATFVFTSEPGLAFECALDGAAFTPCSSPQSYVGPLAHGAHSFAVRAIDLAGNVDPSPATHPWTIDSVAPETTIDTAPPDPSGSPSATFTFSASEPGSTFECRIDADAFAPCTSGDTFPVTEGAHTFEVRATDPVFNVDASPATHTWTVALDECALGTDTCPVGTVCVDAPVGYECVGAATPLCFDGVDDFATAPGAEEVGLLDTATIEFWFRASVAGGEFTLVDIEADPTSPTTARNVGVTLTSAVFGSLTGRILLAGVDARDNGLDLNARGFDLDATFPGFDETAWHHYAIVFTGPSMRAFVDGVELTVAEQRDGDAGRSFVDAFGATFLGGGGQIALHLGYFARDGIRHVDGFFEDFRLSSSARYATAFSPSYPLAVDASTVVAYDFSEGAGTTAVDGTANGIDLTLDTPGWGVCVAAEVRVAPWWTGWIVPFTQSLTLRR